MKKLRITLKRSPIGYHRSQRLTLAALGLRRLNQTVERADNDSVRGMVRKVVHLVECEEAQQRAK